MPPPSVPVSRRIGTVQQTSTGATPVSSCKVALSARAMSASCRTVVTICGGDHLQTHTHRNRSEGMIESYNNGYRLSDKAMPCFDWSWPFTATARCETTVFPSTCNSGELVPFPCSSVLTAPVPDGVAPPFGLYLASVGWWECEVVRITLSHSVRIRSHLKGLGAY